MRQKQKNSPFRCDCYTEWPGASAERGHAACLRYDQDKYAHTIVMHVDALARDHLACCGDWAATNLGGYMLIASNGNAAALWLMRTRQPRFAQYAHYLLSGAMRSAAISMRVAVMFLLPHWVSDAALLCESAYIAPAPDEETFLARSRLILNRVHLAPIAHVRAMRVAAASGWLRAVRYLRRRELEADPSATSRRNIAIADSELLSSLDQEMIREDVLVSAARQSRTRECRLLHKWYGFGPSAFDAALGLAGEIEDPEMLVWLKQSGAQQFWRAVQMTVNHAIRHAGSDRTDRYSVCARNVCRLLGWIAPEVKPGRAEIGKLTDKAIQGGLECIVFLLNRFAAE